MENGHRTINEMLHKQQKSDSNGKFHSSDSTKANPKLHRQLLGKGNVIDMNWQGNCYPLYCSITLRSGRAPLNCTFHTTLCQMSHVYFKTEKQARITPINECPIKNYGNNYFTTIENPF